MRWDGSDALPCAECGTFDCAACVAAAKRRDPFYDDAMCVECNLRADVELGNAIAFLTAASTLL